MKSSRTFFVSSAAYVPMRRAGHVRSMAALAWVCIGLACLFPMTAAAQDMTQPQDEEPAQASAYDESPGQGFPLDDEARRSPWRWFADARLRGETVDGLPAGRAAFSRQRVGVRTGVERDAGGAFVLRAAVRVGVGSDKNRDNARNNDNARSSGARMDEANFAWRPRADVSIVAGRMALPAALSPMLWDDDLRPQGVSAQATHELGVADRWAWRVGRFAIAHPLASRGPRMQVVQVERRWGEGTPLAFSANASHAAFSRLDAFSRAGLARGNPQQAGDYRDDYRIADVQFGLRHQPEGRAWPLDVRVDLARNLGADGKRDAARIAVALGDASALRGWDASYAYQRIQASAVLGAVNSDDWWFHAGARGHLLAAGYGFDGRWALRATATGEKRDGATRTTQRVMLDAIVSF